jgi:hypothetical protein
LRKQVRARLLELAWNAKGEFFDGERLVMTKAKFEPQLDLLEIRRQLFSTRSLHAHNRRVTSRINNLIGELAHLRQPNDCAHEQHLTRMIEDHAGGRADYFCRLVEIGAEGKKAKMTRLCCQPEKNC